MRFLRIATSDRLRENFALSYLQHSKKETQNRLTSPSLKKKKGEEEVPFIRTHSYQSGKGRGGDEGNNVFSKKKFVIHRDRAVGWTETRLRHQKKEEKKRIWVFTSNILTSEMSEREGRMREEIFWKSEKTMDGPSLTSTKALSILGLTIDETTSGDTTKVPNGPCLAFLPALYRYSDWWKTSDGNIAEEGKEEGRSGGGKTLSFFFFFFPSFSLLLGVNYVGGGSCRNQTQSWERTRGISWHIPTKNKYWLIPLLQEPQIGFVSKWRKVVLAKKHIWT